METKVFDKMDPNEARQYWHNEKQDRLLFSLLEMGQITLEEFLEFSSFPFAPKLLEAVKNRKGGGLQEENIDILSEKIRDVGFGTRISQCLLVRDITTVRDLVTNIHDESELLKIRWMGKKSVAEIVEFLKRNNLKFGMK
jgi:DNA-directed RNA polymerase alpha subunit